MAARRDGLGTYVGARGEIKDKIKDMEEYLYNSGAIMRESDKWLCYLKSEWRYDNIYGFIDNRIEYLDHFFESEQQIK